MCARLSRHSQKTRHQRVDYLQQFVSQHGFLAILVHVTRLISLAQMHILQILPAYLPAVRYGGPTFAVHGLCRALVARGHDVEVFTTNINGREDSQVPLGTPVTIDGVIVRYFASTQLRRLFWSPALGRALSARIHRYDIVHLHSVYLWPTWFAARCARKAEIPYVLSPRGMLVKELIKRRSRIAKTAWLNLIERTNLERAAAIHVTSNVEADQLGRFGWHLPRIETIPNGVEDLEGEWRTVISEDVLQITDKKPFVLFLGRLSWKKGLDRLLAAFAKTSVPRLVIVGPDDEGIAASLLAFARELGIASRVQFLTRTVLGADKTHLFKTADLFVLPSYSENFGNTVLEAMQHRLPVIATPEVGAAAILEEAGAGIVVSGEPRLFAAAIQQIATSEQLRRDMGDAGARHVKRHYSWTRAAGEMEQLYTEITTFTGAGLLKGQFELSPQR
jgi:glycosyltransferase involved in cell wall biosynthesis